MKRILLLCLLLSTGLLVRAQQFTARANATTVAEGRTFQVTFTLSNINSGSFTPPDFAGFDIVSGPNRSTSVQMMNGEVNKQTSYTYVLSPQRTGRLTVGPGTIQSPAGNLRTAPITITVTRGSANPTVPGGQSGKELFVRAELSDSTAYPGQQIVLDYRLYTKVNVSNYDFPEEPDFPDFFAKNVRNFNNPLTQVNVGGETYSTQVLRRYVLFPQQVGPLRIPASRLQLGIEKSNQPRTRTFFFRRNVEPVFARTEAISLDVQPLPPGAPADFSGAVGTLYSLKTSITPKVLTTDDDLRITLTVTGDGDGKRVDAPDLALPVGMEVYDPDLSNDKSYEQQGLLFDTRTFTYTVLPTEAGTFELAPSFTYFDPDSLAYRTLRADPAVITVRPGNGRRAVTPTETATDAALTDDVPGLLPMGTLRKRTGAGSLLGSPLFWGLALLPLLWLGWRYAQVRHRAAAPDTESAAYRRTAAEQVARERLARAEAALREQNPTTFYDEIARATLGYVADKLGVPNSQLDKHNVRAALEREGVETSLTDRLLRILQNCEVARFAGMDNSAAMQQTYADTRTVIEGIESSKS